MIKKLIIVAVLLTALPALAMHRTNSTEERAEQELEDILRRAEQKAADVDHLKFLIQKQNLPELQNFIEEKGDDARDYIALEIVSNAREIKERHEQASAFDKLIISEAIYQLLQQHGNYTQECPVEKIWHRFDDSLDIKRTPPFDIIQKMHNLDFDQKVIEKWEKVLKEEPKIQEIPGENV